jgi:uncharacterized protein
MQFVANDIRLEGVEVDVRLDSDWLSRELADAGVRARRGPPGHPHPGEGGRVRGRLSRSGNDIVVRCQVTAAVEADCVRCLEPAKVDIDADLSLLLEPSQEVTKKGRRDDDDEEHELSGDDADVDLYDGETVVLDPFVRETILLEMPNFPLCSETCPGIRPAPGPGGSGPGGPSGSGSVDGSFTTRDAVDPRLAPLGAFRKKLLIDSNPDGFGAAGPATVEDLVAAAAERSVAMGRPVLRSNTHRGNKKRKKR